HTTRGLQEHQVTRLHVAFEPFTGFFGHSNKLGGEAGARCTVNNELSQAAHTQHHVDPVIGHETAGLAMQSLASRSELKHLAGYNDATFRGHSRKRLHHAVEGFRVRIVAIVNDRGTRVMQDLTALLSSRERSQ